MGFELRGSVAVVTGAASGIGAALSHVLAARGCALALADMNAAGLEATAASARARGAAVSTHAFDIGDAAAVAAFPDAAMRAHGRVNVLVNNAGVALGGRFADVSEADFDWLFNINFLAVVRMTRAFMPLLQRQPAAHIVNVSSLYGLIAPPGQAAYASSKFAVRGFTEALRHELAGSPVGVTVVHPGGVKTKIAANARTALSEAEAEAALAHVERLLTLPPEIAAEQIAAAIEARQGRLLIGSDAKRAALIQRLFPASYWRIMARLIG